MRFKGLSAAVLTISLLVMSSLASACDLSCSLQRLHSGCQSGTVQTEDQQNEVMPAGMDMSQNNHTDLAEAQSDSHAAPSDVSCTHEKCSRTSVSLSATGADHSQFKSHAVPVDTIQLPVNLLRASYTRSETSPRKLTAISPLSIHLRI